MWAVSHAGHCMPPETFDMIEGGTSPSFHTLHGQKWTPLSNYLDLAISAITLLTGA